jgi:hypothetical protein
MDNVIRKIKCAEDQEALEIGTSTDYLEEINISANKINGENIKYLVLDGGTSTIIVDNIN